MIPQGLPLEGTLSPLSGVSPDSDTISFRNLGGLPTWCATRLGLGQGRQV